MKKRYLGLISLFTAFTLCSCNTQIVEGPKGDKGDTGENGKDGTDGKDGSQIYTGQGIPNSALGVSGDLYIDTTTGDLYSKSNSGWIKTGNIKGSQGEKGNDGITIKGVSKTSSGNIDTYTITYSDNTTYVFTVTNGSDGKPGVNGEDGSVITIGDNGHWYIDGNDTGYDATGPKGENGNNGSDGVSIIKIEKTDGDGTSGSYDTYTIYYSNSTTSTFKIYNGKDGDNGHSPSIEIGTNGYWYIDGISTGVKAKGEDGNGIDYIVKTSSEGNVDTYTIKYTNGTTSIFVVTNGKDGQTPYIGDNGNWWIGEKDTGVSAKGDTGKSAYQIWLDNGHTGTEEDFLNWLKGSDGTNGTNGSDGISVTNTYIDENGNLICEMSDGSTINAGKVKDTTKHKVNFYIDDDLIQSLDVLDGEKIVSPSEEATAGYTIKQWNSIEDGGFRWLFSAYTVTSDLNLYADFTYNEYTITYVDSKYQTVIDSLTVTYDKSYSLSTIENQTGWTFTGWRDENGNSFANSGIFRIANNLTLNACWAANRYIVTLDPNNGTVSSTTVRVTYDSLYELPTPTRTNYIFLGWFDKNDKKVSSKATWKGIEDATYTAKWTNVQNTYSFDAGDGTCDVETMQIGWEDAYALPTPTPADGYAFAGWLLGDVLILRTGDSWTYSNVGGTLTAKFITKAEEIRQKALGILPDIDTSTNTLTYGLYPQTHVSDTALITELDKLTTTESNGWYFYNDAYYAKLSAKPYSNGYTFDDGTTIVSGTTYWFKCEPITWKILKTNNNEYTLLSNVLLDAHQYGEHYSGTKSKTDYNGETVEVYANNYKYSEIRTWLNTDFFNTAFALNNSYIQTTTVDNSASTTNYSSNQYACENTNDKVFLLSYQDYLNIEYGFTSNTARQCKATDYARANGAYYYTNSPYKNNGWYWTRSPYSDSSNRASSVYDDGILDYYSVGNTGSSVRPSITIKIA